MKGRPGGRPFPPLNGPLLNGASVRGAAQERAGVGTDSRERRARVQARIAAHAAVMVQRDGVGVFGSVMPSPTSPLAVAGVAGLAAGGDWPYVWLIVLTWQSEP